MEYTVTQVVTGAGIMSDRTPYSSVVEVNYLLSAGNTSSWMFLALLSQPPDPQMTARGVTHLCVLPWGQGF